MKSLISAGVLAASLALSANAAMAAAQPVHTAATTAHVIRAVWPDVRRARAYHGPYHGRWTYAGYAASGDVPQSQFGFDAGQFIQGLLGGGSVRYANLAHDVRSSTGFARLFFAGPGVAELRLFSFDQRRAESGHRAGEPNAADER